MMRFRTGKGKPDNREETAIQGIAVKVSKNL